MPPGTYEVAATWWARPNRATNAPFRIFDGTLLVGGKDVNQRQTPNDFTDQGGAWENLDVVDITGNTLVVELSDTPANGYVIADGVWVRAASPLLAAGGEVVSARSAAPLPEADLRPIVHDALSRWAQIDLPGELVNKLERTQFVVADLPGSHLGLAAPGRIYVDSDAAGHGWFIDSTPDKSEEFARFQGSRDLFSIDPTAVDRIDLLTVVSHELGHIARQSYV